MMTKVTDLRPLASVTVALKVYESPIVAPAGSILEMEGGVVSDPPLGFPFGVGVFVVSAFRSC